LQELREKLSLPFTSVEDTFNRLKSLQHWPLGAAEEVRELAQRIAHASSSTRDSGPATRDILSIYKDEVGFPHGSDEDILALSDPPYYTACPKPWVSDFMAHWSNEQQGLRTESEENTQPTALGQSYHREPFAVDVSEGKTDPIYKAHSYHTKVPHLAIVPSILHYTEPGGIVLDGFCGSGMTGVAAQWCGTAPEQYRREVESRFEQQGHLKPTWGARRAVLNDLSPEGTFIAAKL
jgi:hypothetical protein